MDSPGQLRIYIPYSLLSSPSGYCFGKWHPTHHVVFITAIGKLRPGREKIQGLYWENRTPLLEHNGSAGAGTTLVILQRTFSGLPTCHWRRTTASLCGESLAQNVIIILYDKSNITGRDIVGLKEEERNSTISGYSASSHRLQEVEMLAEHLRQLHLTQNLVRQFTEISASRRGWCLNLMWWSFVQLVLWASSLVELLAYWWPSWAHSLFSVSATYLQLTVKGSHLRSLRTMLTSGKAAKHRNRYSNILLILLADFVLGCLVCFLSERYHLHWLVSTRMVLYLKSTGVQLQDLLHWLMGIPAGLKLNSGCAHFMGNFFLYQCYLWIGYLHLLYPLMATIVRAISLSGCLGLTVLLAATYDVLSLLTFHIYCFYVYAAKIFTLQLSALGSLSRLFRGKKWNVLRNRVDSCSYDVDQLFIGTLIFTVLLFLLPTTLLFYTVFTSLQLVVLIVKGFLGLIVRHLSVFPWFTVIRWLMGGSEFRSEVSFVRLDSDQHGTSHICMKLKLMPLSRAIHLTREDRGRGDLVTWSGLVKNLLGGKVIYPWRKLGG